MRVSRALAPLVLASISIACSRGASPGPADAEVTSTAATIEADAGFVSAIGAMAAPVVVSDAGVRSLASAPKAGERIDIPAGTFPSGSTPGDDGRDPAVEPALIDATLNAFSIDVLPYPNDPKEAPRTNVTRDEAQRLCEEKQGRLCSELEWERACKGPGFDAFPSGASWNSACDKEPSRCASGFDVRALGFLREWTSSRFMSEGREGGGVLRGGAPSVHRCAARLGDRSAPASDVGFRCCHGPVNEAKIYPPEPKPPFRRTNIEPEKLAKIFSGIRELSRIGKDIKFFSDPDVRTTILGRSSAAHEGITFATNPVLWSPDPGIELLVATGKGKGLGFVVALWVLPDDKYRFASSFLLLNDVAPVALAYEYGKRKELRWTTCWGCAGETGAVSFRDDRRVVIVQY